MLQVMQILPRFSHKNSECDSLAKSILWRNKKKKPKKAPRAKLPANLRVEIFYCEGGEKLLMSARREPSEEMG